jgi:DnaJ-class molecular chaperone
MKDLYEILNLNKSSSENDIKKAYKKLAFQYHPDKNKSSDAESKFREISEAYDILMNTDKRRMYDNFGYDSISGDIPEINPLDLFQSLFNVDFTGLGENMHSNIFVFSDLSSSPFLNSNPIMKYNLECSLEDLYHGTQKEFSIHHQVKKDEAFTKKSTKYIINIKRGSKNGDNIVVKDGGNYIPELGLTEDLVIQIVEKEHPRYKRKDNDLYIKEDITLCEALTGIDIFVDHLDGPLNIKINQIVKPNQMFQVFNKGMPIKHDNQSLGNGTSNGSEKDFGNLILDLNIVFPESLGEKQKDYLRKILIHLDRKKNDGKLVEAYYYKEKDEVLKEFIQEDEGIGCIQQ